MINTIKKSVLAGILIGLGVIINLQSKTPEIGALLFSFGLLTIITMQLNLYTGKIGYFSEIHEIQFLFTVLIFNCIGIIITTGLYALGNPDFVNIISTAATIKFSKSFLTLFINGFFCGMLIHFAVKNKYLPITILAVVIFILIKAEHCIADFPYLICSFSNTNVLKFGCIILGNSLGAILIERLSISK